MKSTNQQKQRFLNQIKRYAGGYFRLLSASMVLSGLSALSAMLPYLFIWLIARELFAHWQDLSQSTLLMPYAWCAVGFALLGIFFYFMALMSSHFAAFRVERNIRKFSMQKILDMPLGFFTKNTSGKMRKVIDDNAAITHSFIAHQLPDLASALFMPLVFVVFIFLIDWRFGIASLIPLCLSFYFITRLMGGDKQESMKHYMDALENMNSEAVEYVRGIPVVKVFQQSIYSFKRFYTSIVNYKDWAYSYSLLCKDSLVLFTLCLQGITIILTWVLVLLADNNPNYVDIVLSAIFYIVFTPICVVMMSKIMHLGEGLNSAKEAIARIDNLVDQERTVYVGSEQFPKDHTIAFHDVDFAYDEKGSRKALDGVSFVLPKRQTYALVGPSGSGKTTIARLIPRFWNVTKGAITIGGIDVCDIKENELMKNISFVFQSTKLFKMSLLDNIRYARPDASPAEVEAAVDLAQCRDIVEKLPQGLDTLIGSEGVYLSGGEQQRIAIARAILKDAPILILDEATAFSDPENEHKIQQAFNRLMENKTVVMIAHRLPSIQNAHSILVMNNSKLVEEGTHQRLMASDTLYRSMWNEYQEAVSWQMCNQNNNRNKL